MGYNARNDEIHHSIVLIFFAMLAGTAIASARDIEVRCPSEGLFDAPARVAGDIPNPAAGWQTFLEGKPRKVELSAPPREDVTWGAPRSAAFRAALFQRFRTAGRFV
jgi:hypothetical protein